MNKKVLIISLALLVIVVTLRLTIHFVPPTTTRIETEVVEEECQITVYEVDRLPKILCIGGLGVVIAMLIATYSKWRRKVQAGQVRRNKNS
jgi:hypothetical protein